MSGLDWLDDALCRQTDPEAFWPEHAQDSRMAKAVCARCRVLDDCREYAIRNEIRTGIWGGLNSGELRRAIAQRNREQRVAA